MPRRVRLVAVVTLALLLVVLAAVVGVRWWRAAARTDLERAVALAPAGTARYSFTDWAAVRAELGADLSSSSSTEELDAFLSDGYDADLTSASALGESAALLQEEFGWSPATVEWELLAQSTDGAVVVVALAEDTDVDALGDRLAALGFSEPGSEDGVWRAGEEVLASAAAGRTVSPVLQYVSLDADEKVLTTGDNLAYLEGVLQGRRDQERELDRDTAEELEEVVGAAGDALSAAVYPGDQVCSALAMGQADAAAQAEAEQLVDAAGGVHPLAAFSMAVQPDLSVVVGMSFDTEDQARQDADSRAALASGPAPGQGGTFADRFELGEVSAEGTLVTMELRPNEGAYVLSDLSNGPVLFASC